MAGKKLTELTNTSSITSDDLLYKVNDPAISPTDQSISFGDFSDQLNTDSATLTNKTINLTSNTLTGTTAQFNTALSDSNFVTTTGVETITGQKTFESATKGGSFSGDTFAVAHEVYRNNVKTGQIDNNASGLRVKAETGDLQLRGAGNSGIDIDSSGNATISGTLDGRDIAVDGAKLDGIEALADVTDETNVKSALDGAILTDIGTPASTDLILLQDASDSNNLKVAQFSTFGGGGGGGGEANTASNVGTGAGVFKQKTGVDLEFKSVIGGVGLAETGNTSDVTVDLDINSLTADSTPDGATDYVVTYDASATTHKKVLLNNLPGGGGGGGALTSRTELIRALGGSVLTSTEDIFGAQDMTSLNTMVDDRLYFMSLYLPVASTITGMYFFCGTAGSYTSGGFNGGALYSFDGAGNLTRQAISSDSTSYFTATGIRTVPFTSTYSAPAGIYYLAFKFDGASITTAPRYRGWATGTTDFWYFSNIDDITTYVPSYVLSSAGTPATSYTTGALSNTAIYPWVAIY